MKKLLILFLLSSLLLAGCSISRGDINSEVLIQDLVQNKNGTIEPTCFIARFYKDIDRWLSTKNCNSMLLKISNSSSSQDRDNELLVDGVKSIGRYLEKQGLKKNLENISDSYELTDLNRYSEGYENGKIKCEVLGYDNGSEVSVTATCSGNLEDQKALQIKLKETINGGDYPYETYKRAGRIYAERQDKGFIYTNSPWVHSIFKRERDSFEQIYEGNSDIPCSIVNQYNIPSYVYGECY